MSTSPESTSPDRKTWLGYLLVIAATAGWGTSGLFITFVRQRIEISALALAFWRDLTTFLCLFIGIAVLKPAWLRVQRRDLGWLIALGAVSIGSFHVLWNVTVQMNGVAVATVIQEAAPAIVAIAAWAAFREPLTRGKILAIIITFAGCVLVSRLDALGQAKVTPLGILVGLGSAATYGAFSIFGKPVAGKYPPYTVLMYTFGFAALMLFPLQFLAPGRWPALTPASGWFIGLILLPTIASFSIYTLGLRWLSASVAAIVATSEVVFASIYAYLFLGERLDPLQWLGAALVVAGVVVLSIVPSGRAKQPTEAGVPASAS
jgi:drug/metabolite transporter (DMT)-like permease